MSNDKLYDVVFKLFGSLGVIENLGMQAKVNLSQMVEHWGFKPEQIQMVARFIQDVSKDEDFNKELEKRAHLHFFEATKELIHLAEIAKGYQEMGAINLQIAEEFFHLEEEAGVAYEMGAKEA